MSSATLIDTDILIHAGRGDSNAQVFLESVEKNSILAISVVTQMEMLVGCRNKLEQTTLHKFLRRFAILHLTEVTSDLAVQLLQSYRLSHGLLIPDALIAATAISAGIPLASKNQRDYRFIAELNLIQYPSAQSH